MTENEAKTKWCPFTRVGHPNAITGSNRRYQTQGSGLLPTERAYAKATCCIGSECMAWRQTVRKQNEGITTTVTGGYCGLAGKP